jgi:hypothetical protein
MDAVGSSPDGQQRSELMVRLDAARYVLRTYERVMMFLTMEQQRIEEQVEYVQADVESLNAVLRGARIGSVAEVLAHVTDYRTSTYDTLTEQMNAAMRAYEREWSGVRSRDRSTLLPHTRTVSHDHPGDDQAEHHRSTRGAGLDKEWHEGTMSDRGVQRAELTPLDLLVQVPAEEDERATGLGSSQRARAPERDGLSPQRSGTGKQVTHTSSGVVVTQVRGGRARWRWSDEEEQVAQISGPAQHAAVAQPLPEICDEHPPPIYGGLDAEERQARGRVGDHAHAHAVRAQADFARPHTDRLAPHPTPPYTPRIVTTTHTTTPTMSTQFGSSTNPYITLPAFLHS